MSRKVGKSVFSLFSLAERLRLRPSWHASSRSDSSTFTLRELLAVPLISLQRKLREELWGGCDSLPKFWAGQVACALPLTGMLTRLPNLWFANSVEFVSACAEDERVPKLTPETILGKRCLERGSSGMAAFPNQASCTVATAWLGLALASRFPCFLRFAKPRYTERNLRWLQRLTFHTFHTLWATLCSRVYLARILGFHMESPPINLRWPPTYTLLFIYSSLFLLSLHNCVLHAPA